MNSYEKFSEENQKFDILAIPCNKAFVVATEKSEIFKTQNPDHEIMHQIQEKSKEFKINNLVNDVPVLKKIKTLGKNKI